MICKLGMALLGFLLFQSDGCNSKGGAGQNSKPAEAQVASAPSPAPASESGSNACALIDNSEVEALQGAKVQGTVPGSQKDGDFAVSQCYYTVISADGSKNLSVHVEVRGNDPNSANKNALGDLWKEKFQGAKEKKKADKPRPVPGVGDGAYWVGNNKMGALYVLKKDRLVRISVGGPDDEDAKIEKSKTLAEKALKRLS